MKSWTGDERAVVDHFCVPNLTDDAFHRRRRGRSRSCELRYRRRARKYVGARWRHIRRFVFRGMHLSLARPGRGTSGEREKKEGKKGRERERERLSTRLRCSRSVVIRVRLRYVVAYTRQMRSRGNTWGARCVSANVGADSDMRNYDRVTRACAHNAVRLAALYRAPRQKHAKYRDESGVDFRVNDQRWYTGELRVFDSIKKMCR